MIKTNDTQFVIDSSLIRIPKREVQIIESMIADYRIVHEGTGEMLPKAYKKNAYIYINNGIKFYFAIEHKKVTFSRTEEFLTILITSKILKEKYLEGITNENIKDIYDALMDCKVVKFSFESFLAGQIVDIDFKFDCQMDNFLDVVRACKEGAKENIKNSQEKVINAFMQRNNQGIQFSKRETTNIDKLPFLKIYNKEYDLTRNEDNKEFYSTYLMNQDKEIHRRVRIEFTIKNRKHLRKYGIEDSSLKNILNLSAGKKVEMYLDTLSKYFDLDEPEPIKIKSNKLRPVETILITAMDYMISQNQFTESELYKYLLSNVLDKVAKSRKRAELKTLFEKHLSKKHIDTLKKVERKKKALSLLYSPTVDSRGKLSKMITNDKQE